MMLVTSYAVGSLLGEWIDLERRIEQFGQWLKARTGTQGKDCSWTDSSQRL